MNVVLVGPVYPYRGGIAHYTTLLARALAKRHNLRLISFRRQYPAWLYPGRSDRDPSQKPLRVEAEYLLEPLNPLTWRRTAQRILAAQPDLLVLQIWTSFWLPATGVVAALCRRGGIPIVYLVHNVLPHEAHWWDRPPARWALGQGSHFVVQTEAERARLLALLPHSQPQVCPHPIYADFERPVKTPAEIREMLGLPQTGPLLLFFGIVRPYKGLKILLEALGRLRQQGRKINLVVAGEFWEAKESYVGQIERLGLTGQVWLIDRYIPNEEIGLFFTAADAVAAPYVGGTQSGIATLAIAFDRPLVVTERIAQGLPPGLRANVHVAQPETVAGLAEAILAALTRPPVSTADVRPAEGGWQDLAAAIEAATGASPNR